MTTFTLPNTTITAPSLSSNTKSSGTAVYTISAGGSGGSGYVYPNTTTTSATNAIWANGWSNTTSNGNIQIKGNAEIDGDLKIKGRNILELFEKIEERLAILHPNTELESRWEELKELSKRYRELEAEIIEKEKIWAILKK